MNLTSISRSHTWCRMGLVFLAVFMIACHICAADYNSTFALSSEYWRPIIISECLSSFPQSAPCIRQNAGTSNIIAADELMYPPFKLRLPLFISNEDAEAWKTNMRLHGGKRAVIDEEKDYTRYWMTIGQNLVFSNTSYRGDPPPDNWAATNSCGLQDGAGTSASHKSFLKPSENLPIHDTIIVATSPDSFAWQHFLDRVTILIAQASLVRAGGIDLNNLTVVTGAPPRDPFINLVYEALGVKTRLHSPSHAVTSAKNVIFPCRCPLMHPFHYMYVAEKTIGKTLTKPLSERKMVIYCIRGKGGERNGGRRVVNEGQLLEGVTALLAERGRNEKLLVFEMKNYPTFEATKDLFGQALAVFGPHGGSMMNCRFSPAETLVVEFLPLGTPFFFEQSRLMHQNYAWVRTDKLDNDMSIPDVPRVINLFREQLGKQILQSMPPVKKHYDFNVHAF